MATTQEMLDEALAARHKIMLGKAVVSIAGSGDSVAYSTANISRLDAYIAELRQLIAGATPVRSRIAYMVPN